MKWIIKLNKILTWSLVGSFCEFTSKTRFNRSWKIIKDEIYKIPILMNLTCMAVIRLSVPHPAWKVCGRWWNRRTWRRTMNSSPTPASSSSSTCICLQLSVLRTGKMWHLHGFPWCIAKHISQRWCYIYITSTHSLHWHKCYNLHCLIDLAMLECSTHILAQCNALHRLMQQMQDDDAARHCGAVTYDRSRIFRVTSDDWTTNAAFFPIGINSTDLDNCQWSLLGYSFKYILINTLERWLLGISTCFSWNSKSPGRCYLSVVK